MISEWLTINPELSYEEKDLLLWRRYMNENGWNFIDNKANIPKTNILFATGDRVEFLEVYGFYSDGKWIAQNYPYGHIEVREPVIAWRDPITNETYDKISFETIIGNDFIGRVCGSRLIE
jgi:hypothetical protein